MLLCIIVATVINIATCVASPDEEIYYEEPLYMEIRPSKLEYQKQMINKDEIMDDVMPFLRYGRSNYDEDSSRPTRSQLDKNDNFVRFGRGYGDFVRFGRTPHKYSNQNFLRFGRTALENSKRNKRDTESDDHNDKRAKEDFLRFGRGGAGDSFIRYGRDPISKDSSLAKPHSFYHDQPFRKAALNAQLLNPLLHLLQKLEERRIVNQKDCCNY